ncbi:TetR/AcrR family transcriptional regulator [Streptomyces hygroscopicus]|uniref:TetR/AcrR family transcriptional regulator n=1 Tax=Streptomyces hygroscopicus TaxID=1912 RepID=UPI0009A04D98
MTSGARERVPPRERLLNTAARLSRANGGHTAGADQLLTGAGAARATVHRHFPGKDGMVAAHPRERDAAGAGHPGPGRVARAPGRAARRGGRERVSRRPDTGETPRRAAANLVDTGTARRGNRAGGGGDEPVGVSHGGGDDRG